MTNYIYIYIYILQDDDVQIDRQITKTTTQVV
jgi:hypothetical protein